MNGILTMNHSIFGNKFEERRLSKNARKAMTSDMCVPTNAVEMTYDEMEYVDGGSFSLSRSVFALAIDLAMAVICPVLVGIKCIGRFFGKGLANRFFKNEGKKALGKCLSFVVGSFYSVMTNTAISIACDNIAENLFSCLSIGGIASMALDSLDGDFDGYVTFD